MQLILYTPPMRLARLVKERREQKHWRPADLARAAKVSPSTISRIENGETVSGRGDTMARIARALDIAPEEMQATLREEEERTPERRRTPREILREYEEAMPILVDEAASPVSAGYGAEAEAEPWPYWPRAGERGHEFVAVRVVGDCMEPEIHENERVIADKTESPRPGNIVVADHEGEWVVKLLEQRNGQLYLVARQHRAPIRVGDRTRIVGVVKFVSRRI